MKIQTSKTAVSLVDVVLTVLRGVALFVISFLIIFCAISGLIVAGDLLWGRPARAETLKNQTLKNSVQWEEVEPSPEIRQWYARQMMPDNPTISCCGVGDAYYADKARTGPNGETIAIVTDTRPDAPLQRKHVPPGTEVVVPTHKFKETRWDVNPTGHTIIFLGGSGDVYCYLPDGGV